MTAISKELKIQVAKTRLKETLRGTFFDFCAIKEISELLGTYPDHEAMRMLHALHCIKYADMDPELRQQIPGLIRTAIGTDDQNEFVDQLFSEKRWMGLGKRTLRIAE